MCECKNFDFFLIFILSVTTLKGTASRALDNENENKNKTVVNGKQWQPYLISRALGFEVLTLKPDSLSANRQQLHVTPTTILDNADPNEIRIRKLMNEIILKSRHLIRNETLPNPQALNSEITNSNSNSIKKSITNMNANKGKQFTLDQIHDDTSTLANFQRKKIENQKYELNDSESDNYKNNKLNEHLREKKKNEPEMQLRKKNTEDNESNENTNFDNEENFKLIEIINLNNRNVKNETKEVENYEITKNFDEFQLELRNKSGNSKESEEIVVENNNKTNNSSNIEIELNKITLIYPTNQVSKVLLRNMTATENEEPSNALNNKTFSASFPITYAANKLIKNASRTENSFSNATENTDADISLGKVNNYRENKTSATVSTNHNRNSLKINSTRIENQTKDTEISNTVNNTVGHHLMNSSQQEIPHVLNTNRNNTLKNQPIIKTALKSTAEITTKSPQLIGNYEDINLASNKELKQYNKTMKGVVKVAIVKPIINGTSFEVNTTIGGVDKVPIIAKNEIMTSSTTSITPNLLTKTTTFQRGVENETTLNPSLSTQNKTQLRTMTEHSTNIIQKSSHNNMNVSNNSNNNKAILLKSGNRIEKLETQNTTLDKSNIQSTILTNRLEFNVENNANNQDNGKQNNQANKIEIHSNNNQSKSEMISINANSSVQMETIHEEIIKTINCHTTLNIKDSETTHLQIKVKCDEKPKELKITMNNETGTNLKCHTQLPSKSDIMSFENPLSTPEAFKINKAIPEIENSMSKNITESTLNSLNENITEGIADYSDISISILNSRNMTAIDAAASEETYSYHDDDNDDDDDDDTEDNEDFTVGSDEATKDSRTGDEENYDDMRISIETETITEWPVIKSTKEANDEKNQQLINDHQNKAHLHEKMEHVVVGIVGTEVLHHSVSASNGLSDEVLEKTSESISNELPHPITTITDTIIPTFGMNLSNHQQNYDKGDLTANEMMPTEIATTNWWNALPYAEIRKFLNTIFDGKKANEFYTEIARKSNEIHNGQHTKEIVMSAPQQNEENEEGKQEEEPEEEDSKKILPIVRSLWDIFVGDLLGELL